MFTRSGLHAYILTQSSNHARLVPVKLREIVRYKRLNLVTVTKYRKMRSRGVVKKKGKKKDQALSVHDYSHTIRRRSYFYRVGGMPFADCATDYY